MTRRVIVAGTRQYNNRKAAYAALDNIFKDTTGLEVISGMAKGPDYFGKDWAEKRKLFCHEIRADWKNTEVEGAVVKEGPYGKYNAKAGIDRNVRMAEVAGEAEVGYLVLFWDGKSPGSKHMLGLAKERGLKVMVCLVEVEESQFESETDRIKQEYGVPVRGV